MLRIVSNIIGYQCICEPFSLKRKAFHKNERGKRTKTNKKHKKRIMHVLLIRFHGIKISHCLIAANVLIYSSFFRVLCYHILTSRFFNIDSCICIIHKAFIMHISIVLTANEEKNCNQMTIHNKDRDVVKPLWLLLL